MIFSPSLAKTSQLGSRLKLTVIFIGKQSEAKNATNKNMAIGLRLPMPDPFDGMEREDFAYIKLFSSGNISIHPF